jgi:hypothetical protein
MGYDVIDVQYHTSYPAADRMNSDNPIISSSRGLVYGTATVPYAVLDGGPYDEHLEANRQYDFNDRTPSLADIHSRSLTPPDFEILIDDTIKGSTLELRIDITALKPIAARDLTLHTIVIEDTIDNSAYMGSNGQTLFRNVARKLLPNASGFYFSRSWQPGDDETRELSWQIDPKINTERISVVSFIQDDNSKEVLQAATTQTYSPPSTTGEGPEVKESRILLYPNPAGEYVNVYFEQRPTEDLELRIYNMSGRMVLYEEVPAGKVLQTIELSSIPDGLYILELRTERRGDLFYRSKFFHY